MLKEVNTINKYDRSAGMTKAGSSGFSLIELLFAVLIMAIGILGVAGLQVISLQQNRSALLRAEATLLGNDLLDRIRANREAPYAPITLGSDPISAVTNCNSTSCSTLEMAAFDKASWKCGLNPRDDDGTNFSICETLGITRDSVMSTSAFPQGDG